MNQEQLQRFADAWGRKDLDAVMAHFAEESVFITSTGPEPGIRHSGRDRIREAVRAQFEGSGTLHDWTTEGWIVGDRGVLTWRFLLGDEREPWMGCDLLTFRGDHILVKDAYRKVQG
jgi:ketosteroid isomerase-like protein